MGDFPLVATLAQPSRVLGDPIGAGPLTRRLVCHCSSNRPRQLELTKQHRHFRVVLRAITVRGYPPRNVHGLRSRVAEFRVQGQGHRFSLAVVFLASGGVSLLWPAALHVLQLLGEAENIGFEVDVHTGKICEGLWEVARYTALAVGSSLLPTAPGVVTDAANVGGSRPVQQSVYGRSRISHTSTLHLLDAYVQVLPRRIKACNV